jgi:hypothetical protein
MKKEAPKRLHRHASSVCTQKDEQIRTVLPRVVLGRLWNVPAVLWQGQVIFPRLDLDHVHKWTLAPWDIAGFLCDMTNTLNIVKGEGRCGGK